MSKMLCVYISDMFLPTYKINFLNKSCDQVLNFPYSYSVIISIVYFEINVYIISKN